MKMKTQPFKIYGMPQKQFLEGSSQQYRPSSKKKEEKSQINYLTYHPKELEKEQTKRKFSRRNKTLKIRKEINKIEIKKTVEINQ